MAEGAMRTAVLLAVAALMPLAGCGDNLGDTKEAAATASAPASTGTLATALTDAAGLSTVSGALKSSGLATVFDGNAPYTLLAPDDDAFGALGPAGAALRTPENAAAMATVLRAHVLPGIVTTADIRAALKARQGKPVKMTTMAGSDLTFASEGEAITVTAADGSRAKLSGPETAATNGVAIPIDAVLKKVPAAAAG
jgi:uncharacterized surface protein with fasciclin (FAS1) repeats